MEITTEVIKKLRDLTGVSIMQCKKALEEAEGDIEKAKIVLRKQSGAAASKKAERELKSGVVSSYIHAGGTVGSMVELLCETDFVAKNEEFQRLAKDIAMQIAAANPDFVRPEDIQEAEKEKAREIFMGEAKDKPAEIQNKIVEGKLDAYFGERTLLKQAFIKDPERTIESLIQSGIQKFGEKIDIGRIARFGLLG